MLIGLSGKAGSGKDTAALQLCQKHGFVKLAFADKLKEIISAVYDVPLEYFNDRELKLQPHPNLSQRYCKKTYSKEVELKGLLGTILKEMGLGIGPEVRATEKFSGMTMGEFIFHSLLDSESTSPRRAMQLIGTEGFRNFISDTIWIDYVLRQASKLQHEGKNVVITDVRFNNEAEAVRKAGGMLIGITRATVETHNHPSETEIDRILKTCDCVIANDKTIDALNKAVFKAYQDFVNKLWVGNESIPSREVVEKAKAAIAKAEEK